MNEKNYLDSFVLLFQGICYIEPLYDKTKYIRTLMQPLGTSIPEALAYHMNGSLKAIPKNITNLPQRILNPASIRTVIIASKLKDSLTSFYHPMKTLPMRITFA